MVKRDEKRFAMITKGAKAARDDTTSDSAVVIPGLAPRVSLRIADAHDGSRALFCPVIINFCLCSTKDNKT